MKINQSGARFSAIVGIGEKIKKLSNQNGKEYLFLNRGINSVCNIDLKEVVKQIDFNSTTIQVYPPNSGFPGLKSAINKVYFHGHTRIDNLTISAGGMGGLDLVFQTLNIEKIMLPRFYWGAYAHISRIRNVSNETYDSLLGLKNLSDKLHNTAVIICDPNNPVGNKYDDEEVLETVRFLNKSGVVVIFDSPYRRVFYDRNESMFKDLSQLENVIIVESFSKSVGLSGQRLAFVHSSNEEFNREIGIRILYANNGINGFAQELVTQLLVSEAGRKAVDNFREETVRDIGLNIKFLKDRGLLATEFYKDSEPMGIFVVVNKSEEELLNKYIGSVSLSFFTKDEKEWAASFARICVSVPHSRFVEFFSKV